MQACVIQDVSVPAVTGVTYNSVAMTQIGTTSSQGSSSGNQTTSLWYLIAPATGHNNVVISTSGSPFAIVSGSVSYTGANQTGQPDSYTVGSTTNTTDYALSTTVVAANCWLIIASKNDGGIPGAGTGTTSRVAGANGIGMMDSGGTVSTGSQTLHSTNGSSINWNGLIASFKPVGASGGFFARTYYDQIPQGILNV